MANVGSLKKGDKVKCSAERDWNGTHLASFVRKNTYTVIQVGGNNLSNKRIVIGINGQVTAAVDIKYLTPISKPKPSKPKKDDKKAKDKKKKKKNNNKNTPKTNKKKNKNKVEYVKTGEGIKVVGRDPTPSEVEYHFPEETECAPAVTSDALTKEQLAWLKAVETNAAKIMQNEYGFPKKHGTYKNNPSITKWSYEQDYEKDMSLFGSEKKLRSMDYDMNGIRKSMNIMSRVPYTEMSDPLIQNSRYYNRFKIQNPDEHLQKTFSHVFFVRPDCNIYASGKGPGSGYMPTLQSNLDTIAEFYYAKKHSGELLSQLTQSDVNYNHQFMLYLSNKARSFELSDEYITSDTYGSAMTGYKIPYGKDNVESKTAEKFSISYTDDRDLHVYQLHKLWTDYISYVFRGKVYPKRAYMRNKIIDYATCVYYIVCGEDGESIIFWSKYWGVFPLNAPSSAFSYNADNPGGFAKPEIKIDYQYAWKEDYNPLSLVEFNMHSNIKEGKQEYIGPLLMKKLSENELVPFPTPGKTWVGVPFIETVDNTKKKTTYTFKLRFKPS